MKLTSYILYFGKMLNGRSQVKTSTILILLVDILLIVECSHQQQTNKITRQKSSSDKNASLVASGDLSTSNRGVDDILKDTILLLDVLDEKLAAVKNSTPNAMMRDNLRALDGANADDSYPPSHELQLSPAIAAARSIASEKQDGRTTDDESSLDEALVKLADGFASDRRSDHLDATASNSELLMTVATNTNQQQQLNHGDNLVLGAPQPQQNGQQQAGPSAVDAPSQASRASSKRAKQLMAADDNNQLANDSTERHIKFTLDLMQSIFASQSYSAKTNLIESFLISPLSIQMVLMMMHLGAREHTRREISNCLHLTAGSPTSSSASQIIQSSSSASYSSGSSANPDARSLSFMMHQQQLPQQIATAGGASAAPADPMGAKLKRRHQQVSSESIAKQQFVSSGNNSNSKSQLQQQANNNLRHQQAPQQQQQAAAQPAANSGANPHELFGGAMRNLLKDPIVMKALTSANQIFLQKNLPLSPQYEWAIKHYYAADVKLVDFQHQSSHPSEKGKLHADHSSPLLNSTNVTLGHEHQQKHANNNEQANIGNNNIQQMVNDWIERQTRGKISNFLSSPISTSTLMMAINVLYFKGDWQYKFDPSDTDTDAWFTQANGKTVKIPMMVNKLPLAFAHDAAMKTSVIELPYKAQRLGLFLLLPDEMSGIFHTMQMLNSTSFANLISSMRKTVPGADQGINVRIPKFSIESSPRLSQILSQQLGLKSLFMPDVADLSGMFGPYQQQQSKRSAAGNSSQYSDANQQVPPQVGLDELLHKAVLQVDEQGSVAAASSATIVERVGLFNTNYFEADHPFLLFLMDKQTGLVLFSGVFAGNNNSPNNQESQQQQRN